MILFIDDEKRYVDNICSELAFLGKQVTFCDGVDAAFALLEGSGEVEGIVCDVMMPHGKLFTAPQTDENRKTGLRFVEFIRSSGINLPVVLLTNDNRQHVRDESRSLNCKVILKKDYPSFEIAEQIVESLPHGG
jgi:CheY-like chemotaxis protein